MTTLAPRIYDMSFHKTPVSFSSTGSLSKIVSDYLSGQDQVKPFYSFFPDQKGFAEVIKRRNLSAEKRNVLVEVLREQNSNASDETLNNINLLAEEKTFTVTTGHQLNLFTGPLYFIYKIISAIKLSRQLKKNFPENNFIPVYWMASEDHDIEEIRAINISGQKVEWNVEGSGAAGRLMCNGIDEAIDVAKQILGETKNGIEIFELLKFAYRKEHTLSQATRIFVNGLFENYGLVILDPDNAKLKSLFISVMQDDLEHQTSFAKVSETIQDLNKLDYDAQVTPREINLFYLQENFRGRIIKEKNHFHVADSQIRFTREEIIAALHEHPERFSPNVMLRPLYQETVLPNVAYVGGPAEIAYWLEYKKMFDHYNVNFPALVLRSCAMIIERSSAERMKKTGISFTDLFKPADLLAKEFVQRTSSFSIAEELEKISSAFQSIGEKAAAVDITLKSTAGAEQRRHIDALHALEEKVIRAQKKKHETSFQQIQKLKARFFPEGTLQERYDNFLPYYLKYGKDFFEMLLQAFDTPDDKFIVLSEEIDE